MDSEKINLKILKTLIFEVAKNNGASLSNIARKKKINYEMINEQSIFLIDMGLLEYIGAAPPVKRDIKGESLAAIRLKPNIETLQKIANFLDNKELSRFMKTKYYQDNLQYYCASLFNLLNEYKLTPLPDAEYFDYAMKNSPSNVRFFLVDNDIKKLESFYQRCISDTHAKVKAKIRIETFKKYNMYIIWDNLIFGKIQEDIQKEVLIDHVNYFAGYLPLAKRTFEKLLEISNAKEENGSPRSKIQNLLKVLLT